MEEIRYIHGYTEIRDKRIANFPICRHLLARRSRASDPVTLLLIIGPPLLHALPCKIGPGINLNARTAGGEDAYALPRVAMEGRRRESVSVYKRGIYTSRKLRASKRFA